MRRCSVLHIRVRDAEAAIVIQASFRRYSVLISLCQEKQGAIKFQSIVRMHIGRVSYQSMRSAAVFVQSRFRGVVARNIYLGKEMEIARIQSQATPKELSNQNFGNEQNAAMSIQRSTRLFLASQKSLLCLASHDNRPLKKTNLLESRNALIIQSAYRSRVKTIRSQNQAIITIQSALRRATSLRRLSRMNAAATLIQARWRGFLAHFQFCFDLSDIVFIQSLARQRIAERWVAKRRKAIMLIGRNILNWLASRSLPLRNNDLKVITTTLEVRTSCLFPITIYSFATYTYRPSDAPFILHLKVHVHSHSMEVPRLQIAAIILQKCWRRYAANMDYRISLSAIMTIQRFVRTSTSMKLLRLESTHAHHSHNVSNCVQYACSIQQWWRSRSRLQHSKEEDLAAIARAQEHQISLLSRFTLDQASTQLQRVWRGYNIRVDYLLLLAATTKIQRNYRTFWGTRRNQITIGMVGTRDVVVDVDIGQPHFLSSAQEAKTSEPSCENDMMSAPKRAVRSEQVVRATGDQQSIFSSHLRCDKSLPYLSPRANAKSLGALPRPGRDEYEVGNDSRVSSSFCSSQIDGCAVHIPNSVNTSRLPTGDATRRDCFGETRLYDDESFLGSVVRDQLDITGAIAPENIGISQDLSTKCRMGDIQSFESTGTSPLGAVVGRTELEVNEASSLTVLKGYGRSVLVNNLTCNESGSGVDQMITSSCHRGQLAVSKLSHCERYSPFSRTNRKSSRRRIKKKNEEPIFSNNAAYANLDKTEKCQQESNVEAKKSSYQSKEWPTSVSDVGNNNRGEVKQLKCTTVEGHLPNERDFYQSPNSGEEKAGRGSTSSCSNVNSSGSRKRLKSISSKNAVEPLSINKNAHTHSSMNKVSKGLNKVNSESKVIDLHFAQQEEIFDLCQSSSRNNGAGDTMDDDPSGSIGVHRKSAFSQEKTLQDASEIKMDGYGYAQKMLEGPNICSNLHSSLGRTPAKQRSMPVPSESTAQDAKPDQAISRISRDRKGMVLQQASKVRAASKVSSASKAGPLLGPQTKEALETLKTSTHLREVMKAVRTLENSTKLSTSCCKAFASSGSPKILYNLVRSCNRSVPHTELLEYILDTLFHVSKHSDLIETIADDNCIETLIDVIQLFRDKDDIFCAAAIVLKRIVFNSNKYLVSKKIVHLSI